MLKLGFNARFTSFHPFRTLLLYSTSISSSYPNTNLAPMVDFFVKSVGFSKEEAVSVATKVSNLTKSTPEQAQLVLDLLKNSGFDENHIRKLFTRLPGLLRCNVDKTLKPKIRILQELGLSGSDLGLLVSQQPQLLHRSLEAHIVPSLEMLKSVIGCNEELVSFLLKTKSQQLLSANVVKYLPRNLLVLQSYGVPSERVKQLIKQRPLLLLQRTQWFQNKVKAVEEKLGIPPTSSTFCYGVTGLSGINEDKLESWIELFRTYKWSETEISTLLRKYPLTLTVSEKLMRVKLKYFKEELGYGSDYLAKRPILLKFSLDKRIVPRTAVIQALQEKQLIKKDESYFTLMCKPESKFVEFDLLPIKDKLPQLYEYYMQHKSSVGSLCPT